LIPIKKTRRTAYKDITFQNRRIVPV
jgi:hypothetical protein